MEWKWSADPIPGYPSAKWSISKSEKHLVLYHALSIEELLWFHMELNMDSNMTGFLGEKNVGHATDHFNVLNLHQ